MSYGFTGVTTGHQALPYEYRVRTRTGVVGHILWPADTGLRDLDDPGGDVRGQSRKRPAVDPEGLEVAGVDAHDPRTGVGGMGARLPHLVGGDHEVLAQDGDVNGCSHRCQVLEAASEAALLRQHADEAGPTGGIVG